MQLHNIVPRYKSGCQDINSWGEFSLRGRTPLFGIIGRFNSKIYQVIIDNHILPFMSMICTMVLQISCFKKITAVPTELGVFLLIYLIKMYYVRNVPHEGQA